MNTEKKIKQKNNHRSDVEIAELNKLIVFVVETDDLLENLEVKSIKEFEESVNEKSGFVNSLMSATAYGLEKPYNRLLELEILIDNRLTSDDLDALKQLKNAFISSIREKHIEYYSNEEIETKKVLDAVMKSFNALTFEQRNQIGFNHSRGLMYSPLSDLRF